MQEISERSAGIILFRKEGNKKLFLLLHYPSGHWDFVKGRIEKGEDEMQAAIRETREETGIIDINFIEGFKEKIHYTYLHDNKVIKKEVVFFLGITYSSQVIISDEHIDHIWLEYESAYTKTTYQNAKNLLQKCRSLVYTS